MAFDSRLRPEADIALEKNLILRLTFVAIDSMPTWIKLLRPIFYAYQVFILGGPLLAIIPLSFQLGPLIALVALPFAFAAGFLPAVLAATFFCLGAILLQSVMKPLELNWAFAFALALISGVCTLGAIHVVPYRFSKDDTVIVPILFSSMVCGMYCIKFFTKSEDGSSQQTQTAIVESP